MTSQVQIHIKKNPNKTDLVTSGSCAYVTLTNELAALGPAAGCVQLAWSPLVPPLLRACVICHLSGSLLCCFLKGESHIFPGTYLWDLLSDPSLLPVSLVSVSI